MRFFLPVFLLFFLFLACKNTHKEAEQVTQTTVKVPQDFLDFYDRFHRDSAYQLAHISWPLQGDTDEQTENGGTRRKSIIWEQADWRIQTLDFDLNDYVFDRHLLGEMLLVEVIKPKAANFGIERRFAKQSDGEWMLIYYSDIRELK
ncbi:MAG: hypothetical protein KIS77_12025 [Saprospiraceae bacterium]|nr:hypothetical protein [Saprospiraceae bacterium]